jgi:hypothetical protein
MLRQGLFVADICHAQQEAPPHGPGDHKRAGYNWDECTTATVLTRMAVKDGRIVLPDGMSYRVLALPWSQMMTPQLLRKVKELVQAGATVLGPKPTVSPSLSGFPKCDEEIKQLATELWGNADGQTVKENRFGKGRVVWSDSPENVLAEAGVQPDFTSGPLRFIHRRAGETDIYFVANSQPHEFVTTSSFRVMGRIPELWWPDRGRIERAAMWQEKDGVTYVALPLGPSGSVFVVFRERTGKEDPLVLLKRDGKTVLSAAPEPRLKVSVQVAKARYGVLDDPNRTRDVRVKLQRIVDTGETSFKVAQMAEGDDPAYLVVKTLDLEYTLNGERHHLTGTDPETINLSATIVPPKAAAQIHRDVEGRFSLETREPGDYEFVTAAGRTGRVTVKDSAPSLKASGPWQVRFGSIWGAPADVRFDKLISWSEHTDPAVKYFSGEATYSKKLSVPRELLAKGKRLYLDLGNVQVMAHVKLNGKDLGVLWKPPFRLDITGIAKSGDNQLEIKVVNLWPNRLIGDEQLPEDSERNPNGTLKQWPQWLQEGKPSPTGRYTFISWRLWKKDSPLQESGLLGPATLVAAQEVHVEW